MLADGLGCRWAGIFGIPWLVALACLPRLSAVVLNMPKPVMAAALFFNGCLILMGGMEISFRKPTTIRDTFAIGIALLASLATLVKPEFFARLPAWSQPITGSPIAVAALLAALVNLLFLLGRTRISTIRLLDADTGSSHRASLQLAGARQGAAAGGCRYAGIWWTGSATPRPTRGRSTCQ